MGLVFTVRYGALRKHAREVLPSGGARVMLSRAGSQRVAQKTDRLQPDMPRHAGRAGVAKANLLLTIHERNTPINIVTTTRSALSA
jgi:hypothetical protein